MLKQSTIQSLVSFKEIFLSVSGEKLKIKLCTEQFSSLVLITLVFSAFIALWVSLQDRHSILQELIRSKRKRKDNHASFFLALQNTTPHPPVLGNGEATGTDRVVGTMIALPPPEIGKGSCIIWVGPMHTHGPLQSENLFQQSSEREGDVSAEKWSERCNISGFEHGTRVP